MTNLLNFNGVEKGKGNNMHALVAAVEGVESVDLTSFVTSLTGSITPTQILTILGSVIGVGMTFVLMWFGARKLKQIFVSAVTKGKISF